MIEIKAATTSDIENILVILNTEIGKDFYHREQLFSLLNSNENSFCLIALYHSELVGLSISTIFNSDFPFAHTGIRKQQLPISYRDKKRRFGYIKTIAVSKAFQRKGVGSLLCAKSIKALTEKQINAIIVTAWQQREVVYSEKMLLSQGLKHIGSIPKFWKKESITKKYNCCICGNPPCLCTAILFGTLL